MVMVIWDVCVDSQIIFKTKRENTKRISDELQLEELIIERGLI